MTNFRKNEANERHERTLRFSNSTTDPAQVEKVQILATLYRRSVDCRLFPQNSAAQHDEAQRHGTSGQSNPIQVKYNNNTTRLSGLEVYSSLKRG